TMSNGTPFPVDVVKGSERLARVCFYDALRGAGTAERLAALVRVARMLDARWSGAPPEDSASAAEIEQSAGTDASGRGAAASSAGAHSTAMMPPGPLARAVTAAQKSLAPARTDLSRRYAEALEQGATPETWSALADDAAAAKQPDLELGALYFL